MSPGKKETSPKKPDSSEFDKLRFHFDTFLGLFLQEFCSNESGISPLPPIVGDGQSVDLLKLFLIVRENGGFEHVSKNRLWGIVVKRLGFGVDCVSSVELVYMEYLIALEKWVCGKTDGKFKCRDGGGGGRGFVESRNEFNHFLTKLKMSAFLESKTEKNPTPVLWPNCREIGSDGKEHQLFDSKSQTLESIIAQVGSDSVEKISVLDSFCGGDKKCKDVEKNLMEDLKKNVDLCSENKIMAESDGLMKDVSGSEVEDIELHPDSDHEHLSSAKRKRGSMYRMLSWVTGVARNPCDDVVSPLPERSKWKFCGNDEIWKQVLLARENLLLKQHDSQSFVQKNQKMHPSMYGNDDGGSGYSLRERKRNAPGTSQARSMSSSPAAHIESYQDIPDSPSDSGLVDLPVEKQIPLGPRFQANVPTWNDEVQESETRWLGSLIWPLESINNKFVIEREPIGKGRQDSCGCEIPKSVSCVRFHIAERKLKMERELGIAFRKWKFDEMGEVVERSWTHKDKQKFRNIVRSNPASLNVCFWDEIFKQFSTTKSRQDLLDYYFNVFLLQRRADQNRSTPHNIDSDDDESEFGSPVKASTNSPGSLLSAKKARKRVG